jgi:NTP pyrophosphatase (non-canonical NTP hydrolase)
MEQIEKLYGVCDGLNNKFSGNNNPYMILSRLLEESGELASAVHHIEKRGRKIEKHGEPSKENLTKEVFDVLTSVLSKIADSM